VQQGDVEEWILINPNAAIHPFHVHVNAFQVKEADSALVPDPTLVPEKDMAVVKSRVAEIHRIDPANPWRDTFIIPPMGYLRVWTRLYSHYIGKTVFHCHFLAHEETGMIQNFLIVPNSALPIGAQNSLSSASGVKTP
jgi:FtsP/CotA-like multicopper oxidase with cupredoxin domain